MKILFSTHLREWGGGELWMLTAALAMRDRGHEVSLAAPATSEINRRAVEAGLDVVDVDYDRDVDPRSFGRVWTHCWRRQVDVMCLNMDRVLRVGGLAARLAGVPVVLPRRGSEFPLKGHLNYWFQYTKVATGMIVNSQATATTLCRDISWRPAGRVHVLYNGLDLTPHASARDRAAVREDLGLEPEDLVLVSVGELTERKNASFTISVLPSIVERYPRVVLLLVGEGVERQNLARQAAELGVDDRVLLLGFRDDVPDVLAGSDVLLHPAHVEGFGFAVAEAMAAARPTVVSNTSSLPEIVVDGETGALYPPGDADAYRSAILRYLADPVLRLTHGEAGRARVHEMFELQRQMDALESIFEAELRQS